MTWEKADALKLFVQVISCEQSNSLDQHGSCLQQDVGRLGSGVMQEEEVEAVMQALHGN